MKIQGYEKYLIPLALIIGILIGASAMLTYLDARPVVIEETVTNIDVENANIWIPHGAKFVLADLDSGVTE